VTPKNIATKREDFVSGW